MQSKIVQYINIEKQVYITSLVRLIFIKTYTFFKIENEYCSFVYGNRNLIEYLEIICLCFLTKQK